MTKTRTESEGLSPLQRAFVALKEMQARLERAEQGNAEPIAVIGLGCRFPGRADDPDAFWQLLQEGRDAVVPVAPDRYDIDEVYDPKPATPGKTYVREGGYLERVDQFSPEFFRLSPREADIMDPQQRLMLEVSWEALENAGQVRNLLGTSTGVFVGATTNDYGTYVAPGELRDNPHYGTGNTLNGLAGRVSHFLGLRGPSMVVDSACSSSLVTVHLACQSLRQRDCDLALAGGVNVLLSPDVTINVCQAKILAKDGRCKAFDASADGYGRGEGAGLVVLKRLRDALRDRDNVMAVLLGSAINHDGASSGFTVPNGAAQQALLRRAWDSAKVDPAELDYIEAHGTGTPLGDPIEIRALDAVLRGGRSPDDPALLGTVKTNLAHLESAAGIAGLIKVVLSLQHECLPVNLHYHRPNPHIKWDATRVKVVTEPVAWPRSARRRIAGVSAFGLSGTNAHVVVAEAPLPIRHDAESDRPLHALTLSAKTAEALRVLAERIGRHLTATASARAPLSLADVCFTLNTGRAQFSHRLALVAASPTQAAERLERFAAGEASGVVRGQPSRQRKPQFAFLFPGACPGTAGMWRDIYESEPRFRTAFDRCGGLLRPELGRSLLDEAFGQEETGELALFAIEYALATMWQDFGVRPAAVLGHGIGELAAACVAGALTLDDALRLAVARSAGADANAEDAEDAAGIARRPADIPILTSGAAAAAAGISHFVEVGPGTTMIEHLRTGTAAENTTSLPSLLPDRQPLESVLLAAAALWCDGVDIAWGRVDDDPGRRRVPLPTYPFERRRCWVDHRRAPVAGAAAEDPKQAGGATTAPDAGAQRSGQHPADEIRRALEQAPASERERVMAAYVGNQVEAVLGHTADTMDVELPLIELGMDSVMAVQLRTNFESQLQIAVSIGELLEGASVAGLTAAFLDRVGTALPPTTPAGESVEETGTRRNETTR